MSIMSDDESWADWQDEVEALRAELSTVRAQLEAAVTANLDWAAANHTLTEERDAAVLDAKKWEIAAKYSGQLHEQLAERSMALADERDAAVRERDEAVWTLPDIECRMADWEVTTHLITGRLNAALGREATDPPTPIFYLVESLVAERDALLDLRDKATAWRDVGTGSAANLIDQARVHNALRRAVAAVDALGDVTPRSET
jgi:hypothetical protein